MTSYFISQLVAAGIIGLFVGGLLNSITYRLPIMLQNNWRVQCLDFLDLPKEQQQIKFNFTTPTFHCPHCKNHLSTWQILPVINYIWLRGKCVYCQHHISWRYPIVEILSAILAILTFYYFGMTLQACAVILFNWCLLLLMILDLEHKLLVDVITIPLLWLGLLVNTVGLFTTSTSAIWGAILGYSIPWIIGHIYRLMRNFEGVGYGDYKLFAAVGAWLGWNWLFIIMLATYGLSFIIETTHILIKRKGWYEFFSFGPYIAVISWIMVFWGIHIMHYIALLSR